MNDAQSPPMGRRRTKDLDLPSRVYRRGRSFYFVDLDGKWIALGRDDLAMRRRWADLYGVALESTVSSICWRYISDCMGKNAESTKRQYKSCARTIGKQDWASLPPDSLQPFTLARWRDSSPYKVQTNIAMSLLRRAYAKAIEWGHATVNPAKDVAFNETEDRGRYLSDAEVRAIRKGLPEWGKLWLDLSYVTGLRENDVLTLRWDEVKGSVMRRSQKTKVLQEYRVEGDFAEIVKEARKRRILGLYVVADEKGRRILDERLQRAFKGACVAAGIEDALPRDMRAKSGTDAEAQGLDYQALLGHTDRRTSDIYLRNKRTVKAPTLKRKY